MSFFPKLFAHPRILDSVKQLRAASKWFADRIRELDIEIEDIRVGDAEVIIDAYYYEFATISTPAKLVWSHAEKCSQTLYIPNEVFFSNHSLRRWYEDEHVPARQGKERLEFEAQQRHSLERQEERDRLDYERLKKKFEG